MSRPRASEIKVQVLVECFQPKWPTTNRRRRRENVPVWLWRIITVSSICFFSNCPQFHWLLCLNSVWLQGMHVQVMSHKFTDARQESGQVGRPRVDRMAWTDGCRPPAPPSEKYLFSILSRRVTKQVWFPSPRGECVTPL